MPGSTFDLDAYFKRISYDGARSPALDAVRTVVARHVENIPFENLSPLLRIPVQLDIESLQNKLLRAGRGGYCYEQNLLLSAALRAMGFSVTGLAARVLMDAHNNDKPPRTHMLVLMELNNGPWIVDAGFGGTTPTAPLRLEPGIEQPTPHESYRIVETGRSYVLQMRAAEGWRPQYEFDLVEQCLSDYEVPNWYVSTHPKSHFTNHLLAARSAPDRRLGLLDNRFTVRYANGRKDERVLATASDLRSVLEAEFGLRLPESPELEAMLREVASRERGAVA
jgi:N-hydroxyarylamine O-acetyltransferase